MAQFPLHRTMTQVAEREEESRGAGATCLREQAPLILGFGAQALSCSAPHAPYIAELVFLELPTLCWVELVHEAVGSF